MSGGAAAAFTVRREGDVLLGESPAWFGSHVFGGILLAHALHAASTTVGERVRARSRGTSRVRRIAHRW